MSGYFHLSFALLNRVPVFWYQQVRVVVGVRCNHPPGSSDLHSEVRKPLGYTPRTASHNFTPVSGVPDARY
jgi:hypothetical protein